MAPNRLIEMGWNVLISGDFLSSSVSSLCQPDECFFNQLSCLANIQLTSLVRSYLGLLRHLFGHTAAVSAVRMFCPRFALANTMLSDRKQKYLPYTVVIIGFAQFFRYFKVLALPEAITFTYRYKRPQITKSDRPIL